MPVLARHVDIQDMFVAEKVADGTVKIVKVDTLYQLGIWVIIVLALPKSQI